MRLMTLRLLSLGMLLGLAACGKSECKAGETRECYTGPEGTVGIGICRPGHQVCDAKGSWSNTCEDEVRPADVETCNGLDDDCNGQIDDGPDGASLRNACGGCATLSAAPQTACGACSLWTCDGLDALKCLGPKDVVDTACVTESGCDDGKWKCDEGVLHCLGSAKNQCGKCGGTDIRDLGEACTTKEGCPGTNVCDPTGDGVVCYGAPKNNCGKCGEPPVPGIGFVCGAANGCPGVTACDDAGTAAVCRTTLEKNDCGRCGGKPIVGLGTLCNGPQGCPGLNVCNTSGDAVVCSAPPKNNCGEASTSSIKGCGFPNIDLTGSCKTDEECPGSWQCNAEGSGRVCVGVKKNQCGVCSATQVTDLGTDCTNKYLCKAKKVCDVGGLKSTCADTPATNQCGVCSGPNLPNKGNNCPLDNGCISQWACNAAGDGLVCPAKAKNECGKCDGNPVLDLGGDCTNDGCTGGVWACAADNNSRVCQGPKKNSCGVCGGPTITEKIDSPCTSAGGCSSTKICNAAGDALVCKDLNKNACDACGPAIVGLGDDCTSGPCQGKMVCNTQKNGVVCNAPVPNNCGACGAGNVPNIGIECEAANGCRSQTICNASKDLPFCPNPPLNECGKCDQPTGHAPGSSCTTQEACTGSYACTAAGGDIFCNAPVCASANHLVISEISTGHGTSADNQFVEIYNPTLAAIDISGWSLWFRAATGTTNVKLVVFAATTSVPSHKYLLVAKAPGYTGSVVAADVTYATASLTSAGGSVWLTNDSVAADGPTGITDPALIDLVGWGTSTHKEGSAPAAAHTGKANGSIERKALSSSLAATMEGGVDAVKGNGYDSNNNVADFVVRTERDPQNSLSPAKP